MIVVPSTGPTVILTGVDFSDISAHAVRHARELGERLGSELRWVHVREGMRPDPWTPAPAEESWLSEVGLEMDELISRRGTPWIELVRVAAEIDVDLIVVGTHGRTGFQPVQLGSTAQKLALLSPRPVVLVGGRHRSWPVRAQAVGS